MLRIFEKSERVVTPGTPLLEIGFTPRLEIVSDFLTRNAVRIKPGMPALITDWGGAKDIPARVRLVEPGTLPDPTLPDSSYSPDAPDSPDSPDGGSDR